MRLSRALSALCLLFGVRATQLDSRVDPHKHQDLCGIITINSLDPSTFTDVNDVGLIDSCLCQSDLPLSLDPANFTQFGGESLLEYVDEILQVVIPEVANNKNCLYPDHSKPICDSTTCTFECIDGFTPFPPNNPTHCKCDQSMHVCNGQCVAKGPCTSQRPHSNSRRWLGSGSCAEKGDGWLACGVYGNHRSAWECVNTARDLESCGGCVIPLNAYSPRGNDCSAIPDVADVACEWGECVVRDCLHGLVPSADGNSCVSKSEYEDSHHHHHQHGEMEDESAKAYGLEHIPLRRY